MMRIKEILFLFVFAICLLGFVSSVMQDRELSKLRAQQPKIIQTDYKDIGSRRKADMDIWNELRRINKQIQADTLVFDGGNTADTVYLDNKYGDTEYTIFFLYRDEIGTQHTDMPYAYPLSDSSFIINSIHTNDSSVVQWMTIHK